METLLSRLQPAFWGVYRSARPARLAQQEKVWAHPRWLGVLGWWSLLSASDAPTLQPAAAVLGLGLVYCGFNHYAACRLSQGRSLSVPVPLLDKYAHAQHVEIAVVQEHTGMSLLIKDDGQGTCLDQHPHGQESLLYMRERVEACGGTLQVSRAGGQGTEVRVSVPIA